MGEGEQVWIKPRGPGHQAFRRAGLAESKQLLDLSDHESRRMLRPAGM